MLTAIVSVLFFLSGITGLVYEVLWAKYLTLVFGNTAHAHALILSVFLGGLAAGNALLGPRVDRIRRPLRFYALLELGVGVCGLLVPKAMMLCADFFGGLALAGTLSMGAAVFLRFFFCLLVLLIPTFLMGGTLPAISRFLAQSLARVGWSVSLLYFLNSAGAVAGTLAAAFWLIPGVGLEFSGSLAAALNIAIGVASLLVSTRWEGKRSREKAPASGGRARSYSTRQVNIIYAAAFLSGLVSLTYEVVWIRMLALIIGSSTYSFSIMLAAFISGIAIGSLIVHRFLKPDSDSYLWFGLAEAGAGAAILLSFPIYHFMPYIFHRASGVLQHSEEAFAIYQGLKFLFAFGLMALPTILLGMTLPLAATVVTRSAKSIGASVGRVFALNTIGSVLGAAITGLVLMRLLGLQNVLELGAAINLVVGGAVLWTARKWDRRWRLAFAGLAGLALITHLAASDSWDRRALVRGEFRINRGEPLKTYSQYLKDLDRYKLLFYSDGKNMTVAVTEKDGKLRQLRVNGKVDASTGRPDMVTQILVAQIPLIFRPGAEDMMIIGFGSGITGGSALQHPLKRLDIAEISPEVMRASRFFEEVNLRPLEDPRLKIHIQDGRTLLKLDRRRYDIIVSEPSNPWIAGIADLYSREAFQESQARLKKGGIMVQWVHTYEIDEDTLSLVLRTFSSVYKNVDLWMISSDIVLLGSDGPLKPDFKAIRRLLRTPRVRTELKRIGITRLSTLLSLHMADDAAVRRIAGPGPINEDLFPILEYQAPRAFFLARWTPLLDQEDLRQFPVPERLFLSRYLRYRGRGLTADEFAEIIAYQAHSPGSILGRYLAEFRRRYPLDRRAMWAAAQKASEAGRHAEALTLYEKILRQRPRHAEILGKAADAAIKLHFERRSFLNRRPPTKALSLLQRLRKADPERAVESHQKTALLHEARRDFSTAAAAMRRAVRAAERAGAPEETLMALRARAQGMAAAARGARRK